MLFHSADFLKFFSAFALLYWLVRGHLRARNSLIVLGSYLFYGWWDYRFLSLIALSTLIDYSMGLALADARTQTRRRIFLGISIAGNLGMLGFFKYYGFFVDSLADLLQRAGLPFHPWSLQIVLPVGISFYTFQTMSYTLDVFRGHIKPTRDLLAFAAYVSFFPQLVAGPIERARHLLPQFERTLRLTRPMVEEGVWLCLWGLFKKIVVADNLAPLVDMVYGADDIGGPVIALATLAFGLQIYGDFSGYSDMARGLARLLGFDIMVNFRLPYAATGPRDFWRRWHISLSTWLRDYVYISFGGNRRGTWRTYRNLMVTMVLGGLWHGAAWHFVIWGFYHGLGLVGQHLWMGMRPGEATSTTLNQRPRFRPAAWFATMIFVFYGWLLFRAESVAHIAALTSQAWAPAWPVWISDYLLNLALFTAPLVLVEAWQFLAGDQLASLRSSWMARSCMQGALLLGIILYWRQEGSPFIYFQF
jgi:D-alanyl-lipoteichoic acid acyltransferase DltB (MBOAT superfamily)